MILVDFSETLARHRDAVAKMFLELELPFFQGRGFAGTNEELQQAMREANRELRDKETKQGDLTQKVGEKLGIDVSREDAVAKEKKFDASYIEAIQPVDGALEGLRKLLDVDDLVLVTNATCRRVIPVVEKFEMEGFFKQIICLGGTGENKSQGTLFEKMRKIGAWAIIGDNPIKDGAAEKYGITFVDVRVGWGTAVNIVKSVRQERSRLRS